MRRLLACVILSSCLASAESTVVLSFANLSKNSNLDWVGESIAETIREAMAGEGILVLGRDERDEAYKRLAIRRSADLSRASVIKIGETLDASRVVYGQFELIAGNTGKPSLRIRSRVLDLKRMRQSAEFTELGALDDLAALQTHLAWQAIQFATPKTAPAEAIFLAKRPAVRVDAIENYVRGLLASTPEQKHRFFTQAARLDDRYSQPCFQLGRLQLEAESWRAAATWLQRVSPNDPNYREALFDLGIARYYGADYKGALDAFEKVAKWVPLNEVLNNLGVAQLRLNLPSAVDTLKKALEGDESDPDYQFNLGYALWKRGDFTAAADRFRATLDRDSEDQDAILLLGRCLKQSGPRPTDVRGDGLERIKFDFEESVYWQLKAMVEKR
jgi:tetratricopeptide (TPR) repeat protein